MELRKNYNGHDYTEHLHGLCPQPLFDESQSSFNAIEEGKTG